MKPLLSLIILTVFIYGESNSQVNLNAGLVAYYPFSGNANDASGNSLNGVVTNGAQLTTDKYGSINSAYHFDGIDDVILVKDNGLISLPTFTLAYYFMTESSSHQICLGKINYLDGNGATYNSGLNVNSASNTWFNLSTTNSPCFEQIPGTLFFPSVSTAPVSLNEWHCVVNTFDNGNEKIYLDGVLVSNEILPFSASKFCSNTDFMIGSWWSGDPRPFKGKLDEIRVYNRAINIDEINALCPLVATPCNIHEDFTFKQNTCNPLSVDFQSSAVLASYDELKWDFGDGQIITGVTNPVNTYAQEGDYDVQMILVQGACSDTIVKRITVAVGNEDIIITANRSICLGSTLQLLTKPGLNFCWNPVTFLDNPNSPNPVTTTTQDITYHYTAEVTGNNLITNGDFSGGTTGFSSDYIFASFNNTEGQYFVGNNPQTWNGSLSNCADHSSGNGKMLLVNGSPVPNANVWTETITVTPNTNYAFTTWLQSLWTPNPAQLQFSINGVTVGNIINASLPTCTWQQFFTNWNSGNNTTAQISIVNKNTLIQGNDFALDDISFAAVSLKTDSVVITIETPPTVRANNDTSICNGIELPLAASGASTYTWTPANGLDNPNISNPIAKPIGNTQYIVTGTTASGCSAKDTVSISVRPKPVITKTQDTSICKNSSIQLNASGGVLYSWTSQGTLNNPFIPDPIAYPTMPTTYYISVTGNNNCVSSDSVKISIRPDPVFAIKPGTSICVNQSIQLEASGGNQYSWLPANTLTNAAISNPVASPPATTIYTVQVTDTVCGNSSSLTTTIEVIPAPTVKASKSNDVDCSVGSSQLTATGASVYQWSPSISLSNPEIPNPVASPRSPTQYIVKGFNAQGCSSSDSILVDVKAINKGLYLMPSAFTPNNDGLNDCLSAKSWGIVSDFEFSIFNRWGERVFHTNNPTQCWDGTYKGNQQKSDVYTYIIRAKSFCEESVFRKGTIMLIR